MIIALIAVIAWVVFIVYGIKHGKTLPPDDKRFMASQEQIEEVELDEFEKALRA